MTSTLYMEDPPATLLADGLQPSPGIRQHVITQQAILDDWQNAGQVQKMPCEMVHQGDQPEALTKDGSSDGPPVDDQTDQQGEWQ